MVAYIQMRKYDLKLWWPYLLVWFGNAAWLVYYYQYGAYASYGVSTPEQISPLGFLLAMADTLWKAGLYSWGQILSLAARSLSNPSTLLSLGMILISFALIAVYLHKLELPKSIRTPKSYHPRGGPDFENTQSHPLPTSGDVGVRENPKWAWQAVMFGLIGILIGRLPS